MPPRPERQLGFGNTDALAPGHVMRGAQKRSISNRRGAGHPATAPGPAPAEAGRPVASKRSRKRRY